MIIQFNNKELVCRKGVQNRCPYTFQNSQISLLNCEIRTPSLERGQRCLCFRGVLIFQGVISSVKCSLGPVGVSAVKKCSLGPGKVSVLYRVTIHRFHCTTGVQMTTRQLAKCEWKSGLASKITDPLASLAMFFSPSHLPFLYFWPVVSWLGE
jgi:hypothetical protein